MNLNQATDLTSDSNFFKYWMPYLFQTINSDAGKHCYLPLNRIYKPLGIVSRDWLDYNAFAQTHGVIFARAPVSYDNIWVHMDTEEGRFWLYEDAQSTRVSYFNRLELLMVKSLRIVEQSN
jgi:hypothetical protein